MLTGKVFELQAIARSIQNDNWFKHILFQSKYIQYITFFNHTNNRIRTYRVYLLNSKTFINTCFSYSFDVMKYAYNADWKKVFEWKLLQDQFKTIIVLNIFYFNPSTYNVLHFSIIQTI